MYSRPQKLLAELLGTFALVFFSAGTICAEQFLRASAQGNPGILTAAIAYGLALGASIAALSPVSGGHFNPAVTIGFWVNRKLSTFDTLTYWAAQLAGSVGAAYLLRRLPFDVWAAVQLGTPDLGIGITRTNGMIFEGLITFFVVLAFFATTEEAGRVTRSFASSMTLTVGVLVAGPFTGAAFNPARAFGPALAANHWANHGVYWVGPLAGGVAAAWVYDNLFRAKD